MTFRVYQAFETLGDPDLRMFASRVLAEGMARVFAS
jgi:hypothetical protein